MKIFFEFGLFSRQAAFLLLAVLLSGCGNPPTVRGVKAASARVEATVSSVTSGSIKAEQVAELAFGAVGRVVRLDVELGQEVEQGRLLAALENQDLLAQYETARAEADRQQNLMRAQATSRLHFEQARAALELARAAYEKTLIRAPYNGVIAELNLEVGQLNQITAVIPKAPIRIVDLKPRYVRAELDEVDLPLVRVGMPARVQVLAVRRAPFRATVRKVVPYVSTIREQDRTSEFELSVEDEGLLLPVGASADVEVVIEAKDNVLAVPARAVLGRGAERHAFVLENGRARRRAITVGLRNYERAEVTAGLQAGEQVLVPSEAAELSDGLRVKVELEPWP